MKNNILILNSYDGCWQFSAYKITQDGQVIQLDPELTEALCRWMGDTYWGNDITIDPFILSECDEILIFDDAELREHKYRSSN